jgi:hypothetical protein
MELASGDDALAAGMGSPILLKGALDAFDFRAEITPEKRRQPAIDLHQGGPV